MQQRTNVEKHNFRLLPALGIEGRGSHVVECKAVSGGEAKILWYSALSQRMGISCGCAVRSFEESRNMQNRRSSRALLWCTVVKTRVDTMELLPNGVW